MSGYSYAPAQEHDWLAVATAGRLLVARTSDDADSVAALAATAAPEMSVQQVLEVLTAHGLSATGPFALLFWVDGDLTGQGLGVIVRGDAHVSVTTADGPVGVSSRGVTTWTEQVIEGASGFTVELGDGAQRNPALPLTAGAVWVSRIALSGDAASATDAHARVAAPVATPETASAPTSIPESGDATAAASVEETRVFHTSTRAAQEPAESPDPNAASEPDGYDYLFGATVFRPVGAAAGIAPKPESAPEAETKGDHDGRTVLASEISAARRQARDSQTGSQTPAPPPAHSYTLRLPDGSTQALTAPVILGRAPSVSNVPASVLPHLVTLTGDDISRSHVRVAVEGDTVVVTDLHSSNGTHVIAPGKLPQLLRAGEPTPVITGTTIDLGSDVLLHVTEA